MSSYLNEDSIGRFTLDGRSYRGLLSLSVTHITLTIYLEPGKPRPYTTLDLASSISGVLLDTTQVTLLNTVTTGRSPLRGLRNSSPYNWAVSVTFEASYVLFSSRPIIADQPVFTGLNFSLPYMNDLFDFTSFDQVIHVDEHSVRNLLQEDFRRVGFGDLSHHVFGDKPKVLIYTGADTLCEIELDLGFLSIKNNVTSSPPSNKGFTLENYVSCHLEFKETLIFKDVTGYLETLKQLLELILGERQQLAAFEIAVKDINGHSDFFEVHQRMALKEESDRFIYASDRLVHVEVELDEFKTLINNWFSRQELWKFSRRDFFSFFGKGDYSSDSLIKLSNMFDLIPRNAYAGVKVALTDDVLEAKNACRKIFRDLPDSPEKTSMLNALGRLGNKNLKHKIKDRYQIIEDAGLVELESIGDVIDHSVDARNFFVHGGNHNFDYFERYEEFCFLIDTLEFIYVASELIEAGWTFKNWNFNELNFHFLSKYISSYYWNLERLENLNK
ncbi:HEPN domain-containing protein [Psychrobacter sp. TWP2-1-2]|uniref:ApeA N-terminal domain 1-containing protein n=1 Tax=Psychrobacter sp. TWP2-1-2 TaxID=2804623 RepID=UPI003CF22B3B